MSILAPSDFTGRVSVAQNKFDVVKLQQYIDEIESQYLNNLLGCDLNTLFQTDLINGVPQTQRFIDIFDKFCFDIESHLCIHPHLLVWHHHFFEFFVINDQNKSRGIKEMLKGFIYFEYVRDQPNIDSSIGMTKSKGVASDVLPSSSTTVKREYNRSIVDYWNIQFFINENDTIYPEYNGLIEESISIL